MSEQKLPVAVKVPQKNLTTIVLKTEKIYIPAFFQFLGV